MILLAVSTLLDYGYGFGVASNNRMKAKLFLWLSIINNLGILGVFKYYNFFAAQFSAGFGHLGLHIHPVLLQIALPVGISFYTFHGMSYVFDIYRGKQKPVSNPIDYALFVSFFPLLVAGPIERAGHLLPQVQKKRTFDYTQAVEGCRLILWGMFKKVVIADSLARVVNELFQNYESHNGLTLIAGAVAFSFQIYGDFSGYTDIALGSAKLFGFELLSNFRFPYFSRDIAEFWRRWHISLSSWFRDYLYISLGGSREGKVKAVRNTFIVFLVSGFWHGASWNFIIWGGTHACLFLPLLLTNKNRVHVSDVVARDRAFPNLREVIQLLTTFAFVTLAWIFFRAHTLRDATGYLTAIFKNYRHPGEVLAYMGVLKFIVPLVVLDWFFRRDERRLALPRINRLVVDVAYLTIVVLIVHFYIVNAHSSFIYFQF